MDAPALSNVTYDALVVGKKMGPYPEEISAEAAGRLAGEIGEPAEVTKVPPAIYPTLFLKALRRSMGGIPAKSILAKQELEFKGELPVDSTANVVTWIGDKQIKRDRPYVTIEFEVSDGDGDVVLTGRKVIIWPTGPGEVAA